MIRATALALLVGLGIGSIASGDARAQADDYPTHNINFICPFPAGGATDLLVRMLAEELQDKLHKPVIVDNRPGAGTVIAASYVARSAPDGYTLFLAPVTTLGIGPSIYKKLPYDTVKDFAPIGLVGSSQFALVANNDIGAPTLQDLIKKIKSSNGQMTFGSAGLSTPHHLFMEMFLHMIGATAQHVPYRGSVQAMTDVIAGRLQMMMLDLAAGAPQIRAGKLKVYGVTSGTRVKSMPDVPTIAEAGLPGFAAAGWYSVVAPAGTPRPIIDKINAILTAYVKEPAVEDKLQALAIEPRSSTPDELAAYIPAEIKKWAKVVKDAGIQPQ